MQRLLQMLVLPAFGIATVLFVAVVVMLVKVAGPVLVGR